MNVKLSILLIGLLCAGCGNTSSAGDAAKEHWSKWSVPKLERVGVFGFKEENLFLQYRTNMDSGLAEMRLVFDPNVMPTSPVTVTNIVSVTNTIVDTEWKKNFDDGFKMGCTWIALNELPKHLQEIVNGKHSPAWLMNFAFVDSGETNLVIQGAQ